MLRHLRLLEAIRLLCRFLVSGSVSKAASLRLHGLWNRYWGIFKECDGKRKRSPYENRRKEISQGSFSKQTSPGETIMALGSSARLVSTSSFWIKAVSLLVVDHVYHEAGARANYRSSDHAKETELCLGASPDLRSGTGSRCQCVRAF